MGALSIARLRRRCALLALVLQGFRFQTARDCLRLRAQRPASERARLCAFMRALPFLPQTDELFSDLLTTRLALTEQAESCPRIYAVAVRTGRYRLRALPDSGLTGDLTPRMLAELLRREGALDVRASRHGLRGVSRTLRYDGERDCCFLGAEPLDEAALLAYLADLPSDTLLLRHAAPDGAACPVRADVPMLHAAVLHGELAELCWEEHGAPDGAVRLFAERALPCPAAGEDPRMEQAVRLARRLAQLYPEMEYIGLTGTVTAEGFVLARVDSGWELAVRRDLPPLLAAFVRRKADERPHLSVRAQARRLGRYVYAWYARRRGFIDYMYRNWRRGLRDDRRTAHTTPAVRRWTHRLGFYSYRVAQYGLTKENYRDFLSDYDYKRMRPLNPGYQKWFWNKAHLPVLLAPFRAHLPVYWFRIEPRAGGNLVVPYDGGAPRDETAVLALLRREGELALKPAIGSHGNGFVHLVCAPDGTLLRGGAPCTEEELLAFLRGLRQEYLVTEYVHMHPALERIYAGVTGTVRLLVLSDGGPAAVRYAYFRVGTSFTGETDNIASGGLVAPVDIATGRYERAELLREHVFVPCPDHPDTGVRIEGTLPGWEEILRRTARITDYLAPMEYLGFDIVVTADGFRILEINTHQDLHKYPLYPDDVKAYLCRRRK